MNNKDQDNIEKDTIPLDKEVGIKRLYELCKKNTKKLLTKDIQCKYGDFTFTIDINNVKMPLKSEDEKYIQITISKPTNLKFNGQSCNASKKDNENTITIVNYGEELQFENFTFTKQPCNSDNKTILDTIVETGATELFGNGSFDTTTQNPTIYNIKQLCYNKYNTFVIPNANEVNKVFTVQGYEYLIDEKSEISFKPKKPEKNEIIEKNTPQLEFLAIDVAIDNSRKSFDIKDVPAADIKASKANNSVKKVELDYDEEEMDVDELLWLDNDNNNESAEWWRKIFCCCDTKNTTNKEPEINRDKIHKFKNLKGIKS